MLFEPLLWLEAEKVVTALVLGGFLKLLSVV